MRVLNANSYRLFQAFVALAVALTEGMMLDGVTWQTSPRSSIATLQNISVSSLTYENLRSHVVQMN